jgi:hypothetical protein
MKRLNLTKGFILSLSSNSCVCVCQSNHPLSSFLCSFIPNSCVMHPCFHNFMFQEGLIIENICLSVTNA